IPDTFCTSAHHMRKSRRALVRNPTYPEVVNVISEPRIAILGTPAAFSSFTHDVRRAGPETRHPPRLELSFSHERVAIIRVPVPLLVRGEDVRISARAATRDPPHPEVTGDTIDPIISVFRPPVAITGRDHVGIEEVRRPRLRGREESAE